MLQVLVAVVAEVEVFDVPGGAAALVLAGEGPLLVAAVVVEGVVVGQLLGTIVLDILSEGHVVLGVLADGGDNLSHKLVALSRRGDVGLLLEGVVEGVAGLHLFGHRLFYLSGFAVYVALAVVGHRVAEIFHGDVFLRGHTMVHI